MKAIELAKAYDPAEFEDRVYQAWQDSGHFQPAPAAADGNKAKPFVIVMPPPNVTGILHVGHALNNSLQDILIRYHRMTGRPTLWVPGTDHAGIATQHVVEQRLKAKGIRRRDLGREKFIEETWRVKEEHHAVIKRQLQKIGSSCDWSRERFTLDEGLSKAVREVFVTLYERGLIYRGKYLVNWCCSCGTALADDEVEHEDAKGAMYHLRYPYADGSGFVEIATTRPETMLGDTAVACHPDDERYQHLVGKLLELPLTGRQIPLIADSYVDRAFGTGLVKITPAHDSNDFEVGNLVVEDLKALEFFIDEKPIVHAVGHCYRCHNVVEPYLSEQWFVKMRPLADKALKAWRDGQIKFYPQRWDHTYENWMTNIRDWCISRQLWWGHRIPVWYCDHCGAVLVARDEPSICPKCQSTALRQDEDVLDTWFSSWLWPFSAMGWPKDSADLRKFYPTSTLLTGFDIIFFWVARMVTAGLEFTGQVPFQDICMTTLVRDKQGRKMSKSLGNGIDPLEIVDEFGADALRFTLCFMFTASQDILINKDDFKLGSKFSNKVWNASRFILMNLEGVELQLAPDLIDVDRWIWQRLNACSAQVAESLKTYRFNDAAGAVYEYFWNDFCDWYVEATKLSTRSGDEREKNRALSVLLQVLEESLRLHTFLPFVTEEIYGKLPTAQGLLIGQAWPVARSEREQPELERQFGSLKQLVSLVRSLRSEFGIAPDKKLRVALRFGADSLNRDFIQQNSALAALLINADSLEFTQDKPEGSLALAGSGFDVHVFAREAVDVQTLAARFRKEADKDRQYIERTSAKLANQAFVGSAPAEVVAAERRRQDEVKEHLAKLESYLVDLTRE